MNSEVEAIIRLVTYFRNTFSSFESLRIAPTKAGLESTENPGLSSTGCPGGSRAGANVAMRSERARVELPGRHSPNGRGALARALGPSLNRAGALEISAGWATPVDNQHDPAVPTAVARGSTLSIEETRAIDKHEMDARSLSYLVARRPTQRRVPPHGGTLTVCWAGPACYPV